MKKNKIPPNTALYPSEKEAIEARQFIKQHTRGSEGSVLSKSDEPMMDNPKLFAFFAGVLLPLGVGFDIMRINSGKAGLADLAARHLGDRDKITVTRVQGPIDCATRYTEQMIVADRRQELTTQTHYPHLILGVFAVVLAAFAFEIIPNTLKAGFDKLNRVLPRPKGPQQTLSL